MRKTKQEKKMYIYRLFLKFDQTESELADKTSFN